jgi:6-phosphogluconolactonase
MEGYSKQKDVRFFSRKEELIIQLAAAFLTFLQECLANRGSVSLVLGGGRTPVDLNRSIVSQSVDYNIDWGSVLLFFSDERCVAPDHEASNYKMIHETLVAPLKIPTNNINRIRGELEPAVASEEYEARIKSTFSPGVPPSFDLALLGFGPDGHTASLFPLSSALREKKRFVLPAGIGPDGFERITLTFPALNSAKHIWFMISGEKKKRAFDLMVAGKENVENLPACGIKPNEGNPIYFVNY